MMRRHAMIGCRKADAGGQMSVAGNNCGVYDLWSAIRLTELLPLLGPSGSVFSGLFAHGAEPFVSD